MQFRACFSLGIHAFAGRSQLINIESIVTRHSLPVSSHALPEAVQYLRPIMDSVWLSLFVAFFIFRYLRTVVGVFTFLTYRPKPVHEKPRYVAGDVTVVIPTTFKSPGELIHCLRCVFACAPAFVYIVTANANVELVRTCCALNQFDKVQVMGVERLNKRKQMIKALEKVKTEIVVFADDDVFWPERYLDYLLAIFEDPDVGAGGTRQRVRRQSNPTIWNFLGIAYLERRVWNNVTTNAIDGSVSTLSGRTAAYRTEILQTREFFWYFENDSWLGRPLNTDDDKCLTRYVYSHGWKIAIQFDPRSIIETTGEDGSLYISQCLRWARAHWRGNLTVMTNEQYWRSWKYWWGCYVVYAAQFQTPALLIDGLLFVLLGKVMEGSSQSTRTVFLLLGSWILFTKTIKLMPHFCRFPQDVVFLPASILFSYLHGLINVYALFTLTVTHWGSQKLEQLETARAEDDEVVPLLRTAMAEGELYHEPTPGET